MDVAVLSLLLIGAEVGLLIGKRDWDMLDWLGTGLNAFLLFALFTLLFRELYSFFREHKVD